MHLKDDSPPHKKARLKKWWAPYTWKNSCTAPPPSVTPSFPNGTVVGWQHWEADARSVRGPVATAEEASTQRQHPGDIPQHHQRLCLCLLLVHLCHHHCCWAPHGAPFCLPVHTSAPMSYTRGCLIEGRIQ